MLLRIFLVFVVVECGIRIASAAHAESVSVRDRARHPIYRSRQPHEKGCGAQLRSDNCAYGWRCPSRHQGRDVLRKPPTCEIPTAGVDIVAIRLPESRLRLVCLG